MELSQFMEIEPKQETLKKNTLLVRKIFIQSRKKEKKKQKIQNHKQKLK
jgi:hypothetical protein